MLRWIAVIAVASRLCLPWPADVGPCPASVPGTHQCCCAAEPGEDCCGCCQEHSAPARPSGDDAVLSRLADPVRATPAPLSPIALVATAHDERAPFTPALNAARHAAPNEVRRTALCVWTT